MLGRGMSFFAAASMSQDDAEAAGRSKRSSRHFSRPKPEKMSGSANVRLLRSCRNSFSSSSRAAT
jgi:hypothetical protein